MENITIKGVSIGDKFLKDGKKCFLAEIVDILEYKSLLTGEVTGYVPIAKLINGLATNTFDVPFSMVLRWKVK